MQACELLVAVRDINIKMPEHLHAKLAQVRPLGKSFRFGEDLNSVKYRPPYPYSSQNKSCELFPPNSVKNKSNISSHILVREGHYSESEKVARKVIGNTCQYKVFREIVSG